MVKGAWVTLATNDSYSLGALVLAHSLKQVGTQMELAILVTPGVTNSMRARLSEVFNSVKEVNILDSKDKANLKLLQRPELGITFTKLHCWQLTEYEKCVFLDADTLVLQNCDELFEREELSAAPDVGWPDCFNSGVFVYRPSDETYNKLIQFALDKGSFDGGDQGLLNMYFSDWASKDISKHLPFIYNVCSTAFYSYLPAFKQFGKDVKIIHFIGNAKPWLQYFDTESRRVRPSRDLGHLEPILQAWWNIFCSMIHPNLTPDMSGLAGAFAKLTLGQHRTPEQEALENSLRRQNWEQGNIDYLGKDSFDNIWSKICETLAKGPEENEDDNSVQIANDGLVQPSPEQGSALEDVVLPPSQEVSKPADTSKDIAAQEKSPSDSIPSLTSADSPCVVPSEQITPVPQQPESLPAVTEQTPPKETISSAEKVPETTSAIVSEEVPLQKTPAVEPSPEVGDQISSDTPSAQVAVSDTAEDASKSKTIVPTSSETKASVEERAKSNIEQISSGTESSPEEIPKSVTVSDEKITPPTKDTLVSSLSEATVLQKEPLVESPKVPLSEPVGLESPSTPPKPEAPKQDIPPATVLMTPQKPSTPTTEQVPPLTEQIAVCPAKSISPVEETPSLKETTVSPAVQDPTPAPQTIPSTEQSPVLGISCPLVKPSAPVHSPEQKQVSSEKSPPSTIGQSAPLTPAELPKQADTGSTLPEISQQKATAPEPTSEPIPPQTSAVTQTPTAASDETPPPPITAPPRKNGGKKNQGKSKK